MCTLLSENTRLELLITLTKEILPQMYQPYTTQKQSISPTVALIRYTSTKKHITMDFPSGVALNAVYINNFSHEILREGQIPFKGPITIHLVASGIQNC